MPTPKSSTPPPVSFWFLGVACLFVTCLIISNIVAVKLAVIFGLIYALTDSLFAPAVIHAAIDLRMLIVATPQRMRALGLITGVSHSINPD